MKTLIVNLAANGGGVNAGETGSVKFTLKETRSPRQYYGLAVARMNLIYDWGNPWTVVDHEIKESE